MKTTVPQKEEEQSPQPIKVKVKKEFFTKLFLALAALILIPTLFAIGRYYYTHYLVVTTNHGTISVFDKEPTPLPTSIVTPTPKPWSYTIFNTKTNKPLLTFQKNDRILEQWNDFLFYSESDDDHEYVVAYNLHNFEMFKYDIRPLAIVPNNPDGYYGGIHSMYQINNDLYISIGGYMVPGGVYYMPMPPTQDSTFTKITDSHNASIKIINDRYFIIGGEGDGCGGWTEFSLLDPATKTATSLLTSHSGCSYGDEFLDYDSQYKMIVANRSANPGSEIMIGAGYTNIINYVYALNLENPSEKEFILTKEEMPEDIYNIAYDKDKNQLILYGYSIYTYNIASKQLTKVVEIPSDWMEHFSSITWKDNYLCRYDYSSSKYIAYNIKESKVEETHNNKCSYETASPTPELPYEQQQEQVVKTKLKKLKLPEHIIIKGT